MMIKKEIYETQNEEKMQSIIVAQHYEYKAAKILSFILICFSVFVPIVINVLSKYITDDVFIVVSGSLLIASIIIGEILKNVIEKKKKNAAYLQQYFDLTIFKLEKYEVLDPYKIATIIAKYKNKDWDRKKDWYSKYNGDSHIKIVFKCQQENLQWTNRIGVYYISFLIVFYIILLVFFLLIAIMNSNWTFFMIQLISCIPLGKYIYSSAKKIIDDQIKLKESLDFSKKINFNLADLSDEEIEALVVTLQNKIYSIRKKRFLIPDWFEAIFYKKNNRIEQIIGEIDDL